MTKISDFQSELLLRVIILHMNKLYKRYKAKKENQMY